MPEKTIFEKDLNTKDKNQNFNLLPEIDVPQEKIQNLIPSSIIREDLPFPELSELDVVRHFVRLSQLNFSVDTQFYPLGSCTMKYNPKVNEEISHFTGFEDVHPLNQDSKTEGILEVLYDLEKYLCEISGFDAFTLQPAAGAHGELTALLMMKAYHEEMLSSNASWGKRNKIIIPDSSHGTNPASVALVGYAPVIVKSDSRGNVDLSDLRKVINPDIAGLMLTNPNTLGLFDENILEIVDLVHSVSGIVYYDGANTNATLGICRPADLGFDIAHFNLHKTFSTPHGGGGPGAGPVGVNKKFEQYLPVPRIIKDGSCHKLNSKNYPKSIGKVHSFYGNVNVLIKAYAYIRSLGAKGLKKVSVKAVENANYLMNRLKNYYYLPYDRVCQHEFVLSAKWQKQKYGVKALDIAKRLIDYDFHPPTIYFPLIVEEALMIEPTESESKETLDAFCDAMIKIAKECEKTPDIVKSAPHTTKVRRLDETRAARYPDLKFNVV